MKNLKFCGGQNANTGEEKLNENRDQLKKYQQCKKITWTTGLRKGTRTSEFLFLFKFRRLSLVVVGEVIGDPFRVRLHGLLAGLPSGWADFSVLVGELECLDQTESFVDVAAHRKIVDGDLEKSNFLLSHGCCIMKH